MAINLKKGDRINLSKEVPSLKRVRAGLGWSPNTFDTGADFDLDVSFFMCERNAQDEPKLVDDNFMIFYNQLKSPDNAVVHSGDSRKGDGSGDDEIVTVELAKVDSRVVEISVIVTIHEAVARKQTFGQVSNSYIKLYDDETGKVIMTYSLEDEFSGETAVQFGSLYKKDGQWLFKAVGAGFKAGLDAFVTKYSK